MKNSQRGFAHIALILAIVVVLVIAGVAYRVLTNKADTEKNERGIVSLQAQNTNDPESSLCQPAKEGLFTSSITDFDDIISIQNPIRVVGGNNIKTHSFVEVSKRSPVYAPMDAELSGGANYYEAMGPQPVTKVQYILAFNSSCDVSFWLDHLVDVPDKIKTAFPEEPRSDTQGVEVKSTIVKSGELLGYSNQEGRARFDFGATNLKGPETSLTTNPKFKDDPIVKTSEKYRHATCPYKLYSADMSAKFKTLYDPTAYSDQYIVDDICK